MTATVVFVHGRAQEFRDPAELTRKWLAGLNAGLTRAALPTLAAERVVLPYYGNVLYRATARLARERPELDLLPDDPDTAGPLHPYVPAGVGETERRLVADMAAALALELPDGDVGTGRPAPGPGAARHGGAGERGGARGDGGAGGAGTREPAGRGLFEPGRLLSWDLTRRLLIAISRRTRVDQEIITEFLRDVAVYLTSARAEVLDAVRRGLPASGPLVLVTHSLGTVVGRDLLDDEAVRRRTALWVTTGSPLGLEAVQNNMRPPGARHPGAPVDWVSAYDVHDIVALGHPLRPMYGDPLRDLRVQNGDAPHRIDRYLDHVEVARPIGEAVART